MTTWLNRHSAGAFLAILAAMSISLSARAETPEPATAIWSPWDGLGMAQWKDEGLIGTGRPAATSDATNRVQVFARVATPNSVASRDTLWHIRQSGKSSAPWQPWTNLGALGGVMGDPVVGRNADGRLEVFCRGQDGDIHHIWQTDAVNDQWSAWERLGAGIPGRNAIGNPTVSSGFDGRLDVFVTAGTTATGFTLRHLWQRRGAGAKWEWSPSDRWEDLGGPLAGSPVVGTNGDGRLEVFARGRNNELEHISQVAFEFDDGWRVDLGWSSWEALGTGGLSGDPAVGTNVDGRLEVFVHGAGDAVWHIWQTTASSLIPGFVNTAVDWSPWESLQGTRVVGDPIVGRDLDGRLQVFIRAGSPGNTSLWRRQQTSSKRSLPTDWTPWQSMGVPLGSDPALGTNWDGRLEVFALANDRSVEHSWQTPPIQWVLGSTKRLRMQPPGNRTPDARDRIPDGDLGQSVLHDGKLYVYLDDGTSEYADPIGALAPTGGAAAGSQGVDLAPDRDAEEDFSAARFNYRVPGDAFSSLFRLDTPVGPRILGQDQGAGGGFSYDGHLYVFGYVRFLDPPQPPWVPSPDPDGLDTCTATGHSMLSSASNPWGPYQFRGSMGRRGVVMTGKFNQVAPVLVNSSEIPLLPKVDDFGRPIGEGVVMLGQGGDRAGEQVVSLAWLPLRLGRFPNLSELKFYKGSDKLQLDGTPEPAWSSKPAEAKALFETRYFWSSISMGRIRSSGKWIVLYQKTLGDVDHEAPYDYEPGGQHPEKRHDGIYARIGRTPWDWSPEVKIFDPDRERVWGDYIRDEVGAFPYGAALLNPYTNWDATTNTVTIQYLLSTQHPYGVVLMRSQIKINQ